MSQAQPMTTPARTTAYRAQNNGADLTPKQTRRVLHKARANTAATAPSTATSR